MADYQSCICLDKHCCNSFIQLLNFIKFVDFSQKGGVWRKFAIFARYLTEILEIYGKFSE